MYYAYDRSGLVKLTVGQWRKFCRAKVEETPEKEILLADYGKKIAEDVALIGHMGARCFAVEAGMYVGDHY